MRLASTILQSNVTTVYSVVEQKGIVVSLIEAVNTHAAAVYVNFYITVGNNDFPILPIDFELKAGIKVEIDGARYLPYGAQLRGIATVSNKVKTMVQLEDAQ